MDSKEKTNQGAKEHARIESESDLELMIRFSSKNPQEELKKLQSDKGLDIILRDVRIIGFEVEELTTPQMVLLKLRAASGV